MKRKWRFIKWLMLLVGVLFVFSETNYCEVQAATKATKAKKAYRSFLTNIHKQSDFKELNIPEGNIYFVVKDLSGDKVPELLIKQAYTYPQEYFLYTYRNGKVKKLKYFNYYVNGELTAVYPKKHVIEAMEGDSWDAYHIYYKVTSKKVKIVAREKNGKYYVNGKKVSYSKYVNYVNSIKKNEAYSFDKGTYKFRKNTAKNRNKYIK